MALTLFMYHRILPREYPGAISAETFERQLDYLAKHYTILRAEQLEDYITGALRVKGDCAGLSFDDAWADNLFYAEPILRRRGLSALLAVSASCLHDGPVRQGEYWANTFSAIETSPIPRRGTLMIRSKETSSRGLIMSLK